MKTLFAVIFTICVQSLSAQDVSFQDAYNQFKEKAHSDYTDFRKRANEEYASFLEKAWKRYHIVPKTTIPKDKEISPINYKGRSNKDKRQIVFDDIIQNGDQESPQPKPISPIKENDKNQHYLTFKFYGTEMKVRYTPLLSRSINTIDRNGLADAWRQMSTEESNNLIRDCLENRLRYKLCDWAYYKMLEQLVVTIFKSKNNEAVLLQAYLYAQSGYKMRLAITGDNRLLLFFNSNNMLFDFAGLKLNDGMYYTTDSIKDGQGIEVCDIPFFNEAPMSMTIVEVPLLAKDYSTYRIISAKGCDVETRTRVNKNLISFFNDYPTSYSDENFMTRWKYYADTPLSDDVKVDLYPQLKKSLVGKELLTAANILLNYIQTGMVYEYDDKIWGHDRAFFAEETLYYPCCDCEDRAIIYSRLVRDILGLEVVLVYYPGHMCTAVNFTDGAHGDYISLNGKVFTIADPTYIGAPVGATMPGMDNKTAKVILLNK